jgi:RNA polymerase sigma-70 factor, ECF subfamily
MIDADYIKGFMNKDRKVETEFVNRHYAKIISVCFHFVKNQTDAEDLAQEVFLELFASIGSFRQKSQLSTWMYRIAVNKSINHLKKRNLASLFDRLNPFSQAGADHMAFSSPVKEPFQDKDHKYLLEKSIGSLPENQRIAFVLCKYDDFSYQEISEIMNVSLSSVESLVHRAKINLQKKLLSHFPEYSKSV